MEGARDDAQKAADDQNAFIPRDAYREVAAQLEIRAARLRVKIADLETQRRLLQDD